MNEKICANCHQSNQPEMSFCLNCGTELSHDSADDLPATVMAGNFGAFPQQPNFQQPNFQQPNFQQPNFQPNFQQPNFQPNFQTAPTESGGNTTKILAGIGGVIIGLIFLAAGGVQLYKVVKKPGYTQVYSSTPQDFYSNTSNSSQTNSSSSSSSNNGATSTSNVLAVGNYYGAGKNVTYNKSGSFHLQIYEADAEGKVRARFTAYNGLEGTAAMTGTVSSSGKLLLEGKTSDGKNIAVNGMVNGNKIAAGYAIGDSKEIQSGNFALDRHCIGKCPELGKGEK